MAGRNKRTKALIRVPHFKHRTSFLFLSVLPKGAHNLCWKFILSPMQPCHKQNGKWTWSIKQERSTKISGNYTNRIHEFSFFHSYTCSGQALLSSCMAHYRILHFCFLMECNVNYKLFNYKNLLLYEAYLSLCEKNRSLDTMNGTYITCIVKLNSEYH